MIKKILKKYFNGFVSIQMILAVVFCGIVLVPKLFGYTSFAVLSDSMYPEIKKGYMVFVESRSQRYRGRRYSCILSYARNLCYA